MKELKRYRVNVAGIQETKWFGKDVWEADGYTLLHFGRTLPDGDASAVRGEGVGILLDPRATTAWRKSGEVWEAVSSRVGTARFKAVRAGQRKPGRSRETKDTYVTAVSAYAPTAKAPPIIHATFRDDLQDVLDKIPPSDIFIILVNFNVRVGRSTPDDDLWRGVRGQHGIGDCNKAGEELLEFCAVNDLTMMNTWFMKKPKHMATWKHPATKEWHTIDYIMMRAAQCQLCCNIQVMRGASCWSDHNMVRGKVRINLPRSKMTVSSNIPLAVHLPHDQVKREAYQQELDQCLLDHPHFDGYPAGRNWIVLKECIMRTAEKCVRRERKRQPDWFTEAQDTLQPLLETKRQANNRVLHTNSITNKRVSEASADCEACR